MLNMLIGKTQELSMAIFKSYACLPEGVWIALDFLDSWILGEFLKMGGMHTNASSREEVAQVQLQRFEAPSNIHIGPGRAKAT